MSYLNVHFSSLACSNNLHATPSILTSGHRLAKFEKCTSDRLRNPRCACAPRFNSTKMVKDVGIESVQHAHAGKGKVQHAGYDSMQPAAIITCVTLLLCIYRCRDMGLRMLLLLHAIVPCFCLHAAPSGLSHCTRVTRILS